MTPRCRICRRPILARDGELCLDCGLPALLHVPVRGWGETDEAAAVAEWLWRVGVVVGAVAAGAWVVGL